MPYEDVAAVAIFISLYINIHQPNTEQEKIWHNSFQLGEQTSKCMKNNLITQRYIWLWTIDMCQQGLLTWEICFSEYCASAFGTRFTGNELTPKTLDSPDPVVLDTFKLPAEKVEPLPSSNFSSFGGRLIDSKESWTMLPDGVFIYALLLWARVPLSGTWVDLSSSLLIACVIPDDTEGPACYY